MKFTVTIPDFDDVVWTPCDDGLSAEAEFCGVSLGVTTIDGDIDINIWFDGDLCDGVEYDYATVETLEDAKEEAYDKAVEVVLERLLAFGGTLEVETVLEVSL